ncbi:DNA polymerase I [Lysobacter sp. HDW10]|uniref:DNA polymerase I n=1 Tax=Lysobacter sp. HDW10 TaxID=2714936 RepID=UPI0014099A06|nr:DNA polymerase I [Lysobacter sp. HDW10]QIK80966.1 DNA polymerase I [Lysobacter sp. HDW10]
MSQKIILIDGSSYLFRAFHALPPLSNAQGEPTGALFGVVNMLRAHLKEQPDYIAFVMDASGGTFRNQLDPQYKANRPPMPDELRAQLEPLKAIVQAMGLPLLCVEGVEADDVIGTLAKQASEAGVQVEVSTSDKDMAQLVAPKVMLVNTMTGTKYHSDDDVMAKFGVRADQIIDFLALMGDKVDNIPGVPKCGEKTAAKWLAKYDTLDGVMAHADEIGGKIGESLRESLTRLPLNRDLTRIKTDVDLGLAFDDLSLRDKDTDTLRTLYTRYGMNQALKDLDGKAGVTPEAKAPPARAQRIVAPVEPSTVEAPAGWSERGSYEAVLDEKQLAAWVMALSEAKAFAFDTETSALDPMRADLVGLSFSIEALRACYIPVAHEAGTQLPMATVLDALRPVLENPNIAKLGQNAKYDLHVLRRHGINVQGVRDDSLLSSFVLDSTRRHDMDTQAERSLGLETIPYEAVAGKGAKQIPFARVDIARATEYAAEDADITLRLNTLNVAELEQDPALLSVYRTIEMPLLPVLTRIEANGVLIDDANLKKQSAELSRRMLAAVQRAADIAGRSINLDSPKQLGALLFDELGLKAEVKTPSGAPSTNEEALEAIADQHELPRVILEYRGLAKLRNTYTEKLPLMINPDTGRVHTSYNQAGAQTGRLSSNDPNLQNIPIRTDDGRRVRTAFVAPKGRVIVACDYSQIELRIMAHLSGDEALVRAFESGDDVHRATAGEVFGKAPDAVTNNERRAAKAINFGLMYGMSAFGLAKQLGVERHEAAEYIALYFSRYPGVRDYMEQTRAKAKEHGYVETVFGRRLYLPYIHSRNQGQRAGAERAAINAPMQGTAADIIKRAMVSVDAWIADYASRALMIMQVHDELVFECDADFAETLVENVSRLMTSAADLRVPLVVDSGIGENWEAAH